MRFGFLFVLPLVALCGCAAAQEYLNRASEAVATPEGDKAVEDVVVGAGEAAGGNYVGGALKILGGVAVLAGAIFGTKAVKKRVKK